MSHIDEPDEDGTYVCPKCKGVGFLPSSGKCPFCRGNSKIRICKVITKRKLNYLCWGTDRPDGRCLLTKAKCRKDEEDFWIEVDCEYCEKGINYSKFGSVRIPTQSAT